MSMAIDFYDRELPHTRKETIYTYKQVFQNMYYNILVTQLQNIFISCLFLLDLWFSL